MRKQINKQTLSFVKAIQMIGRPAFFLFTIVVVTIASFFHLLKLFIQKTYRTIKNLKPRPKHFKKINKHIKKKLGKKWSFSVNKSYLWTGIIVILFSTLGILFYVYILADLPSVKLLADSPPSLTTKIYDRHGVLLYQIYKDENRSLVSLKSLPKHLVDATLSAEDKNFYHHFGIDLVGITRAALNNLRCAAFSVPCSLQGGSTITQQLIKNTLLSPEKTLTRKVKELILSIQTEIVYSKDQILEMYLNQVGYGGTAYGIEEAAHGYFGKSSKDLTLSESAMLAGLPIAPTILSPFGTNPYLGKIRQQQVLESMVQAGKISEADKIDALSIPLVFHPQGIGIKAPHFVMYVKDLLVKQYGEDMVARGGLSVTTTLDLGVQNILQAEIDTELLNLSKLNVQNGAGLITNPKNGEILAMVGSRDFFDTKRDGQVNIVLQERQPGSSIKPITYALALSNGATPNTTIEDTPICYVSKGQPSYCPKNYDGKFHGKVTLRTALGSSYNIPAIKLLNTYGVSNMINLAKNMGISTWDDPSRFGLSLTLGGGEIKMIDLAGAYSVFANGGKKIPFNPILSITDPKGSNFKVSSNSTDTQVISPAVAYQINSILSDVNARSPAFGFNSILNLPGKNIAVKTGTTNNLRDNWTFGYTEDLLISTWVGNNDNSPMSSVASGITGASPIWARTMQKITKDNLPQPFTKPENIIAINLTCAFTPKYEYFVKGTEPKINCKKQTGTLLQDAATTSK